MDSSDASSEDLCLYDELGEELQANQAFITPVKKSSKCVINGEEEKESYTSRLSK